MNTLKQKLYTVYIFSKINTRRFFRDKRAIFFSIGFPLIFLFVLGSINNGTSNAVSFNVAILNQSKSAYAKQFEQQLQKTSVFKVNDSIKNLSQAKDKMGRSELDAVIILPSGFGEIQKGKSYPSGNVDVQYTQNNAQSAQALTSLLEAQFKKINQQLVSSDTPFTVTSTQLNEQSLSSFDYIFAGLLGFAIIGMGIFGPVNVFPELKKMGILRRLSTTPLKVWQYFLSTVIGQAIIGLLSLIVMIAVALVVFHLHVVGNYIELALFIIFGIVSILGIGLAIGGWAKNERQAAPLSNIVVFPMMFLSGTFFPRFLMPEWLQQISTFLPLTPIIDGIRMIATQGTPLTGVLPQLGLMSAWTIVIYAIAFKVFRWE